MSSTNQQKNTGQIDPQFYIAKYLLPILEHKWIVILCTLLGLSVAIPISFLIKPEYSSTATTQVETPRAKMISKVTEEISSRTGNRAYITAAVERMHSSAFRTEVLKVIPEGLQADLKIPLGVKGQLKSILIPLIKKLLKKEVSDQTDQTTITPQKLVRLSKRIEITGNTGKGTVQLTGTTYDQAMTTVLVQSYIDVWVALNMDANKSLIRHELEFTKAQLNDYKAQLKDSENELRLFKQKFEIPPALTSVTDMELQSQLDVLQNKLENAKERYKRIDDIFLELSRKEKAVVNNIKVINPPQVPLGPSKNMQIPIILLGLILGAATGIAPILAWDYYRGNIRHKKDIYSAVDIPIIGKLPTIK
ncbi:MAG TPA: hypothetical protein EYP35_10095 [Desulfobacterales bacterium]|nr:hypothetical protein [Desulfobacterales bacterium]HIP37906.1 hypothetical protein [Desulfocapsa sulfexigens]